MFIFQSICFRSCAVTFVVVSYFQGPFLAFGLCVLRDKGVVCVGRE